MWFRRSWRERQLKKYGQEVRTEVSVVPSAVEKVNEEMIHNSSLECRNQEASLMQ